MHVSCVLCACVVCTVCMCRVYCVHVSCVLCACVVCDGGMGIWMMVECEFG